MQASIDYGISDREDGQRTGGSLHLRPGRRQGQHHRRRQLQQVRRHLVRRPRFLQGRDLPLRRFGVHRSAVPAAIRAARSRCRRTTRSRSRMGCTQRDAHPGRQRLRSDCRLPLLRADRRLQLPGRQPGADAAGTHQRVLPRQLPDDRRRQRVHRGLPQQDRGELRDRAAAVRRHAPTRSRSRRTTTTTRSASTSARRTRTGQPFLHAASPRSASAPASIDTVTDQVVAGFEGYPRRHLEVGLRAELRPPGG